MFCTALARMPTNKLLLAVIIIVSLLSISVTFYDTVVKGDFVVIYGSSD